jgi:hypothetical protein
MDNDTKAALKAVLEFYADRSNYAPDISDVTGVKPDGTMQFDISGIEADEGAKARDAIAFMRWDEITEAARTKALEFYANSDNYVFTKLCQFGEPAIEEDYGERARDALGLNDSTPEPATDESQSNGIRGMYNELKTGSDR